jgi:hypothetical protein
MSTKTEIIEKLFQSRLDPVTNDLSGFLVTLEDVSQAIQDYNLANPTEKPMSTRNPANFFKDFFRKRTAANRNWPDSILERRYSAKQVTGGNACFEFYRMAEDQIEPFPLDVFAAPSSQTPRHRIESVSLPLASRRLGRSDEPWLIQVVARLRLVETHFSLFSTRSVKQIDLLQMNVKLSKTEIDALYLGIEEVKKGEYREVIITCEAKGKHDDILEDQILRQAIAPFAMKQVTQDEVIPMAFKCIGPSMIYVVEFEPVKRDNYLGITSLKVSSDSVFEIHPPVPGICE